MNTNDLTGQVSIGLAYFQQALGVDLVDCSPEHCRVRVVYDSFLGDFPRGTAWDVYLVRRSTFNAIKQRRQPAKPIIIAELDADEVAVLLETELSREGSTKTLLMKVHCEDIHTGDPRTIEVFLDFESSITIPLL